MSGELPFDDEAFKESLKEIGVVDWVRGVFEAHWPWAMWIIAVAEVLELFV